MIEDKKNIERLFQERFKDFEVTPRDAVWKNIKNELEGNKPARWTSQISWKWTGIAAAMLVLLGIGGLMWYDSEPQTQVSMDEYVLPLEDFVSEPTMLEENLVNESVNVEGDEVIVEEDKSTVEKTNQGLANNSISSREEDISDKNISDESNFRTTAVSLKDESLVEDENTGFISNVLLETHQEDEVDFNPTIAKTDPWEIPEEILKTVQERIALKRKIQVLEEQRIATENKKSIFEDIAKNQMEEETTSERKGFLESLTVRPNVAPIYYNSMTGGSGVDPELANHSSKGDITASYGLDFSYAVTKKIKVRTGVSKVNMSYNTQDLAFIRSSSPHNGLKGVGNNPQADQIIVIGKRKMESLFPSGLTGNMVDPFTYGQLNQKLEYIEVPFEVEFALLDKKFGINLIGGASTLFLNDDVVEMHSELGVMDLGRANNLNTVSLTTNVGIGFEYNFTNRLNLNFEPSFKYQLGGYSGDTNGFRPYYIGLYSGISYKF